MSPHLLRRLILEQSNRAHIGHIGSSLSIADIIAALYGGAMCVPDPDSPHRDRLVLSKGHAVLAVYAALYLRGWISSEQLDTFCQDGTQLGVHPEHALRGIDFCTGSLGQGLSMGVGAAFAAKIQNAPRRVFVVLSDAECNEGAVWEAVMFAAHHKLSNLTVIIDLNGQQALGHTEEVLNLNNMAQRWQAFGWDAHDVDGHDVKAMQQTIEEFALSAGKPHVLVAHTTFGKGVSFMESQIKWHYWPMNEQEFALAIEENEAQTWAATSDERVLTNNHTPVASPLLKVAG